MLRGTIVRFMKERGFGFIQVDGGTDEYYFHCKDVHRPERLGEREITFVPCHTQFDDPSIRDRVVFEAHSGYQGKRARRPETTRWAYEDQYDEVLASVNGEGQDDNQPYANEPSMLIAALWGRDVYLAYVILREDGRSVYSYGVAKGSYIWPAGQLVFNMGSQQSWQADRPVFSKLGSWVESGLEEMISQVCRDNPTAREDLLGQLEEEFPVLLEEVGV